MVSKKDVGCCYQFATHLFLDEVSIYLNVFCHVTLKFFVSNTSI